MPDIALMGAVYPDVPAVTLPVQGGGTARFTDVSDTTAAAADVASGKYFYTDQGVRTAGAAASGVEAEPLSVVRNGTYTAPTGKAYTPVTVNVGDWARPADWPDLDSITLPNDFDGLYLTYDLRKMGDHSFISLHAEITGRASWYVERGHLSNGVFIVDETNTVNSHTIFRKTLDPVYGNVQLWRVTASADIIKIGFRTETSDANASTGSKSSPVVEIRGAITHSTDLSYIDNNKYEYYSSFGSIWTERIDIKIGQPTTMAGLFSGSYSLQSVNTSGWDTSHVTAMNNMFNNCYALKKIDVSGFDVKSVTNMNSMFASCWSLESIDMSTWETNSLTTATYMFSGCGALKEVHMEKFVMTNVTSAAYMFYNINNIRKLHAGGQSFPSVTNNNYPGFQTFYSLTDYINPFVIPISMSYGGGVDAALTVDSMVAIINSLPITTDAKTVTLGMAKAKLTAAQIAVATEKGWTIA